MSSIAQNLTTYRFVLSLVLAAGGIACIWYGYRLFADGAGQARSVEKISLKNREFALSASGMSVGGLLMLTSGLWSYFAYSSIPRLEIAGDAIKIVSPSSSGSENPKVTILKTVKTDPPNVGASVAQRSETPKKHSSALTFVNVVPDSDSAIPIVRRTGKIRSPVLDIHGNLVGVIADIAITSANELVGILIETDSFGGTKERKSVFVDSRYVTFLETEKERRGAIVSLSSADIYRTPSLRYVVPSSRDSR